MSTTKGKGPELISLLSEGKTIALVTDAGTQGFRPGKPC